MRRAPALRGPGGRGGGRQRQPGRAAGGRGVLPSRGAGGGEAGGGLAERAERGRGGARGIGGPAPEAGGRPCGAGPSAAERARFRALVAETRRLGTAEGLNVVAFSGGVDSSLVALLVHAAFGRGGAVTCVGTSPSLPEAQLALAELVAAGIGIELWKVPTEEGRLPGYVANAGEACFHCKTELYGTLERLARGVRRRAAAAGRADEVVLFNGTNADDRLDPTRLGLLAARDFGVASPLAALPKAEVRAVARAQGLPNWDTAAAPCLRSRLQHGVPASAANMAVVERAEAVARRRLRLADRDNLRVRLLHGAAGVLEVDPPHLAAAGDCLREFRAEFRALGIASLELREFRSGALSGAPESAPSGGLARPSGSVAQ